MIVKVDAVRVVELVKVVGLFIEVYATVDDGSAADDEIVRHAVSPR